MSEDYSSVDYQMSILQAAKEGKHIEISARGLGRPLGAWVERTDTVLPFNFASNCYRVKKEPRRFTVWCHSDRHVYGMASPQDRELWLKGGWELIEVVEVMK